MHTPHILILPVAMIRITASPLPFISFFFFFFNDTATTVIYPLSLHDALPINDTATTEIYPLSLHDALPISVVAVSLDRKSTQLQSHSHLVCRTLDRKSTRLNSSHTLISSAVFCLKTKQDNTRALTEPLLNGQLGRVQS